MSDPVAATTQPGAAVSTEDEFQSFYDQGGMNDEPPRDPKETAAPAADNASTQDAPSTSQPAIGDDPAPIEPVDTPPQYASLSELLTAHKIDPESVMGLHVTTKIDGKETQVPLSDVLKSYQLEGHVNNKSIELSNQRAALEAEQTQFRQAVQQEIQRHQAAANLAVQMLSHDYQRIDWNGLRANNPAEFAALQTEFQQRQQQIGQFMQNVGVMQQEEAQRELAAKQQMLAGENERLMGARPEWRDPKVFTQDREQMTQYARNLGFKDADLNAIYDHRYMLILHDAARYRALQAASPQALKQVRQAPVMAAPGSRTDVNPNEANRRKVVDRLNRNPRDVDAQAAAFEYFANQ
ncbi:conserved protein of unknown function [Pararobbsia alpina]|uniref:hypothetical protein n=1 Tax=Pararobbsia alpina TaxID=621374 RepID=UPI0039A4D85B